jgi:hypothetical protein
MMGDLAFVVARLAVIGAFILGGRGVAMIWHTRGRWLEPEEENDAWALGVLFILGALLAVLIAVPFLVGGV